MFYDSWDSFEEVEDYGERTVSVFFSYLRLCVGMTTCLRFEVFMLLTHNIP